MTRHFAVQRRSDANHAQVKAWYEELFCSIVDLSGVGFGCPDLLAGIAGRSELVEVKTEDGDLEASQIRFQKEWRGSKVTVVVTREDVVAHVQRVRSRFSGET